MICPLVGLIKDQKQEAQSMGISCASLQDLQLKEKVTEQMIFASAEEITEDRFRVALNENESLESLKRISAIVVDESHIVETWTGKR